MSVLQFTVHMRDNVANPHDAVGEVSRKNSGSCIKTIGTLKSKPE